MAADSDIVRRRKGLAALPRLAQGWMQPLVSSGARDRRDVMALLVAVIVAVAPHFEHLPWWSTALVCVLWVWRAWLTIARRPAPGRFAMVPLLIAASAMVWLQHGSLLGHDAGVNLLVLLMGMKLLELRSRRDMNIVVFLAFFVQVTTFLYSQSLLLALLSAFTTLLLFFVLLSVNLAETDLSAGRKAKIVLGMFVKAIPLIAVLFLLFPRLPRPLWAYVAGPESSSTGLSDSMAPGSINRLIESDDVAFRVHFLGQTPSMDRLYWRGPVFTQFDGRTWTARGDHALVQEAPLALKVDRASAVEYVVTLEPNSRNWVMALEVPLIIDSGRDFDTVLTDELQAVSSSIFRARTRYRVVSYTSFSADVTYSPEDLRPWLQLPEGYDPQTRQFAADLRNRAVDPADPQSHARDAVLVDEVLKHFRRNGFHYTLQPPALGRNSIDDFLFGTRLGFCEHYAASFVFLMRAMGVPARVVTGYQGGEINTVDGNLTVRQSDAHAWAEVWLPNRGWRRVDPTAVVSPVRIEMGESELAGRLGWARYRGSGGILGLTSVWRMNLDALENLWNQSILNYSSDRQRALMYQLGFAPNWRNLMFAFGISVSAILVVLAFVSLRFRRRSEPLAQLVDLLRMRLKAAGFESPPTEGLSQLQQRLEPWLAPAARSEAAALLSALQAARYGRYAGVVGHADIRRLRARVRRFRPLRAAA
jgi:protein-glutamine gamma-glutamyltransferase